MAMPSALQASEYHSPKETFWFESLPTFVGFDEYLYALRVYKIRYSYGDSLTIKGHVEFKKSRYIKRSYFWRHKYRDAWSVTLRERVLAGQDRFEVNDLISVTLNHGEAVQRKVVDELFEQVINEFEALQQSLLNFIGPPLGELQPA